MKPVNAQRPNRCRRRAGKRPAKPANSAQTSAEKANPAPCRLGGRFTRGRVLTRVALNSLKLRLPQGDQGGAEARPRRRTARRVHAVPDVRRRRRRTLRSRSTFANLAASFPRSLDFLANSFVRARVIRSTPTNSRTAFGTTGLARSMPPHKLRQLREFSATQRVVAVRIKPYE